MREHMHHFIAELVPIAGKRSGNCVSFCGSQPREGTSACRPIGLYWAARHQNLTGIIFQPKHSASAFRLGFFWRPSRQALGYALLVGFASVLPWAGGAIGAFRGANT